MGFRLFFLFLNALQWAMDRFHFISHHCMIIIVVWKKSGEGSSNVQARAHVARHLVKTAFRTKAKARQCTTPTGRRRIQSNLSSCAKEVGVAYGLCTDVLITKDFRDFIHRGAENPLEKTRDEHWQREILSNHHTKRSKTIFARDCAAHESTRKHIQETQSKNHEDHNADNKYNSIESSRSHVRTYTCAPGSRRTMDETEEFVSVTRTKANKRLLSKH